MIVSKQTEKRKHTWGCDRTLVVRSLLLGQSVLVLLQILLEVIENSYACRLVTCLTVKLSECRLRAMRSWPLETSIRSPKCLSE